MQKRMALDDEAARAGAADAASGPAAPAATAAATLSLEGSEAGGKRAAGGTHTGGQTGPPQRIGDSRR